MPQEFAPGFWCLGVCGVAEAQGAPQKTRGVAPRTNVRGRQRGDVHDDVRAVRCGYEGEVNEDNWSTFRTRIRSGCADNRDRQWKQCASFTKSINCGTPGRCSRGTCGSAWLQVPRRNSSRCCGATNYHRTCCHSKASAIFFQLLYGTEDWEMWQQVQPEYDREIERLHDPVSQIVLVAAAYLREMLDPSKPGTFTIVVEPLVGRITNVRNTGQLRHHSKRERRDTGGRGASCVSTFLLDPLPLMYPHVAVVKRPVFEIAAKAPRLAPDLKEIFPRGFPNAWCARGVESEADVSGETRGGVNGKRHQRYVLVRPIFKALTGFENSEPSMRIYFPDLVRSIDVKAEEQRVAGLPCTGGNAGGSGGHEQRRSGEQAPGESHDDSG